MTPIDLKRLGTDILGYYKRQQISTAAAGLSYFLTMTFFPMLICLYTMLGALFPRRGEILRFFEGVLPEDAISVILDYLGYVSDHMSGTMLILALTVMASSSSTAFRIIYRRIGAMWGKPRFTGIFAWLFSFCFSLIFLAAVYFSVLVVVTGKWFLDFADRRIMFMNISESWRWGRFVLMYLLLFVILSGVYKLTSPRGRPLQLLPGAALAALALVAVSILFSAAIGASAKYPLIYGSLASIIVMMLWLYLCGVILFLGGAFNAALNRQQSQNRRPLQ